MKTLLPILAFVLLTGCDGVYQYRYEGTLFRIDGKPASYTPYELTFIPRANAQNHTSGMTDALGHFQGRFTRMTGWVFVLRPPPPAIGELYLSTSASSPIKIKLNAADQAIDNGSRHIILPAVTLPH